jgi:hypothetical protein
LKSVGFAVVINGKTLTKAGKNAIIITNEVKWKFDFDFCDYFNILVEAFASLTFLML